MKKTSILSLLSLLFVPARLLCAQTQAAFPAVLPAAGDTVKAWVLLKDKGPGVSASVARSFEDAPLHEPYLRALAAHGFSCDARLKWQNRVSGRIAYGKLAQLRTQPFVKSVSLLSRKQAQPFPEASASTAWFASHGLGKIAADSLNYGASKALFDTLRVSKLHNWMSASGLRPGLGLRIAVIDADFNLGHSAFAAIKSEHRILDQWDFVANAPQAVRDTLNGSHGASCLSLIGGNLPGGLVGVAPHAGFLLYRAEDIANERYVEEDYVAAAIERAVDSGAQVISISLGYRYDFSDGSADYPFSSMNGRTLPASLAALGAARRNVLVTVATGNLPLKTVVGPNIVSPADADSIVSVGIAGKDRRRCSYSCMGPTYDGRIKPELASMGVYDGCLTAAANPAAPSAVTIGAGTSFAAPVVAGIAALLRQLQPNLPAQQVRSVLMASASRASQPNDSIGWGLVDAWQAQQFASLRAQVQPPLQPIVSLNTDRFSKLYHPGGSPPLALDWNPDVELLGVTVTDLRGRRVDVNARVFGARLLLEPRAGLLARGVYLVRIRSGFRAE